MLCFRRPGRLSPVFSALPSLREASSSSKAYSRPGVRPHTQAVRVLILQWHPSDEPSPGAYRSYRSFGMTNRSCQIPDNRNFALAQQYHNWTFIRKNRWKSLKNTERGTKVHLQVFDYFISILHATVLVKLTENIIQFSRVLVVNACSTFGWAAMSCGLEKSLNWYN